MKKPTINFIVTLYDQNANARLPIEVSADDGADAIEKAIEKAIDKAYTIRDWPKWLKINAFNVLAVDEVK